MPINIGIYQASSGQCNIDTGIAGSALDSPCQMLDQWTHKSSFASDQTKSWLCGSEKDWQGHSIDAAPSEARQASSFMLDCGFLEQRFMAFFYRSCIFLARLGHEYLIDFYCCCISSRANSVILSHITHCRLRRVSRYDSYLPLTTEDKAGGVYFSTLMIAREWAYNLSLVIAMSLVGTLNLNRFGMGVMREFLI